MSYDESTNHQTLFINNCFGAFYRGVLDWFAEDFYPRFNYKVIGTYDKAVEFFNKKRQLGSEVNTNILPSITLDPVYDFSQDERAGRFPWQTQFADPLFAKRLFNSYDLMEQGTLVTPIFSRYEGNFELIFWLSSVYELMDFRTKLLQYTGGFNRYISPRFFSSFITLPDELLNYQFDDGSTIDWGNTPGTTKLLNNINQEKFVLPITLNPIWKLESLNDNSTKYGGDQIAEYKLSASFKYEINLPTYTVISTNLGDIKIDASVGLGKVSSNYSWSAPYTLLKNVDNDNSKYLQHLKNFRCFKISDPSILPIVQYDDTIINNPKNYDIIGWSPIKSGRLVNVIDETTIVSKDDIIFIDTFNLNMMHQIRLCKGVLSSHGSYTSTLYKKCSILNKPILISSDIYSNISFYFDQSLTIDFANRVIYDGIIEQEEIDRDDPYFGYNVINYLKLVDDDKYKQLVIDTDASDVVTKVQADGRPSNVLIGVGDGLTAEFELNQVLGIGEKVYIGENFTMDYNIVGTQIIFNVPPPLHIPLYLKETVLPIKDTNLISIYQYTEEDELLNNIVIGFTNEYESRDIIINSYLGLLLEGKDWTLDMDTGELEINIKPKKDEILEIFLCS